MAKQGAPPGNRNAAKDVAYSGTWKTDAPSFYRYITAPFPVGIGADWKTIQKLAAVVTRYDKDPGEAPKIKKLRTELLPSLPGNGEVGNGRSFDNIKATDGGTSREYTLRRLKRDDPALAERVMSGELSANAAAIEAGFRKRPTPIETALRAWLLPLPARGQSRVLSPQLVKHVLIVEG